MQFTDLHCTDLCTAILLLVVCKFPTQDLANVHIDMDSSEDTIVHFIESGDVNKHCKTIRNRISLICMCQTPQIDGLTSAAVYGDMQDEYSVFKCLKCNTQYHTHCLKYCNVSIPLEDEFICMQCSIPDSLPWHCTNYTNTCTVDNFEMVLLLYMKQNPDFLSRFGNSEVEEKLKSGLTLMSNGALEKGKTLILEYFHLWLNIEPSLDSNKHDFFGDEHSRCLCLFSHVWKLSLQSQCISPHCPANNQVTIRCPSTYSFSSATESFQEQVNRQFPKVGDTYGYCGAEFRSDPPASAPYSINDRLNVDEDGRTSFYECRGVSRVLSIKFSRPAPWLIPVNIASLSGYNIMQVPRAITVFGVTYTLAGITMNSSRHFTAVIPWFNKLLCYDGIPSNKTQRLLPFNSSIFGNKVGSYAYYCL